MNSSRSLLTRNDVRQARLDADARAEHRAILEQNKLNVERAALALYPEIGVLTRNGTPVFYVAVSGSHYESSSLDVVARKVDGGRPRLV